jgi:mycothiol synthase
MTDRNSVESDDVEISASTRLTANDVAGVNALSLAAAAADEISPFSEHVLLHVDLTDEHIIHLVARATRKEGPIVGYAQIDQTPNVEGPSGELAVAPAHRRHGVGSGLLHAAQSLASGTPLRFWAHGDLPAAQALAASLGYHSMRSLWQMRRPLTDALPAPDIPDGVTIRTFHPGADEAAWLAVNAASFAHHPEQGSWTAEDLGLRMAEPWFDPNGFFIAERAGEMVGFHWTKVHPDEPGETGPIGEVYVVGVAPSEAGRGLGRALTLAGLQHLREIGLANVLLYVDADNAAAMALYDRLGFTRWRVDVMYGPDADPR